MPPSAVAEDFAAAIFPVGAAEPPGAPGTTLVASSFFQSAKSAKSRAVLPRSSAAVKSAPMYWYTAPFSPLPAQLSLRRIFSPNLTCRLPEAVV